VHDSLRRKILKLLDQHRLMTLATNRPDGWPQATVGYVKDGLTLYFLCSLKTQKGANLARDSRVSLTSVDHDVSNPMAIAGLSTAAQANSHRSDRSSESRETAAGSAYDAACHVFAVSSKRSRSSGVSSANRAAAT
jgi:general stress protein 26